MGTRMEDALLAIARPMDCLIHHVAYVENLVPKFASKPRAARISPRLPSWMRSVNSSPRPVYPRAIEMTSLRLHCTSSSHAASSPFWMRAASAASSRRLKILCCRACARYRPRTSGPALVFSETPTCSILCSIFSSIPSVRSVPVTTTILLGQSRFNRK
jgi:hypothetical protein